VYHCLADYRAHHRVDGGFLPPAFTDLQVLHGGVGAGTVFQFWTKIGGRTDTRVQTVTEPEPGRVLQESGAHGVKLEGGQPMADTVRALVDRGIPVMGHLGLTPQSGHALGGYRVEGREKATADRLLADARALEEAGACAIVLELLPATLAQRISAALTIPTIGIGAGPGCDGQVLVLHDMLGLNEGFNPKFLKRYAELGQVVREAARSYAADVRDGSYPGPEHSFE
jgi:3-methyl-2-oxobutanoate hydroxymethyltransferase